MLCVLPAWARLLLLCNMTKVCASSSGTPLSAELTQRPLSIGLMNAPLLFCPICAETQMNLLLSHASGSVPACSAFAVVLADLFLAKSNLFFRIYHSGHLLLEAFLPAPGWTGWPAGPTTVASAAFCGREHIPYWSIGFSGYPKAM